MHDVRRLLDAEASRVRGQDDALETVLRRSHRRRLNRRLASGAVAVLIALGGLSVAFAAFRPAGPDIGVSAGGFSGIWPQRTRAEAEAAQVCSDAGEPGCTWQTDADQVVKRYAAEELGWGDLFYVVQGIGDDPKDIEAGSTQVIDRELDTGLEDESGPIYLSVSECHRRGPCQGADLVLARLVRPDPTGIWSITSAGTFQHSFAKASPSPEPAPAETPVPLPPLPQAIDDFVDAFMAARLAGHDAEHFLTSDALHQYDAPREGGLSLYGYTTEPGTSWEVSGWWRDEMRADTFRVVILMHHQGSDRTEYETLRIGGFTEGSATSYSVLSAERNE